MNKEAYSDYLQNLPLADLKNWFNKGGQPVEASWHFEEDVSDETEDIASVAQVLTEIKALNSQIRQNGVDYKRQDLLVQLQKLLTLWEIKADLSFQENLIEVDC